MLRFFVMEINEVLELWNSRFGGFLPISSQLLDATFFSTPPAERLVLEVLDSLVLAKIQESSLHVHLALNPSPQIVEVMRGESVRRGLTEIRFGGGDGHIFPGIPLNSDVEAWLRYFEPVGPAVMDFEGDLAELTKVAQEEVGPGVLRQTRNRNEEELLIAFVKKEFPGRWHREILIDREKGFMEHYHAYFMGETIAGYARLYGWRDDYWAPGVYFVSPGNGGGGLGPIGVAAQHRGQGLGSRILKSGWEVLHGKGCRTVRVDWTTEKDFYERAGLELVQTYQPASRKITPHH